MSTRVQWLGHACLRIDSDGQQIVIDPFLTGNPVAAAKAGDIKTDFILVSHGHGDHLGDTVAIAQRTGATVVCNYEMSEWLQKQGVKKVHGQQHGGGHGFPFGRASRKEAKSLKRGPAGLRLRPLASSLPGPQPFRVKPTW